MDSLLQAWGKDASYATRSSARRSMPTARNVARVFKNTSSAPNFILITRQPRYPLIAPNLCLSHIELDSQQIAPRLTARGGELRLFKRNSHQCSIPSEAGRCDKGVRDGNSFLLRRGTAVGRLKQNVHQVRAGGAPLNQAGGHDPFRTVHLAVLKLPMEVAQTTHRA